MTGLTDLIITKKPLEELKTKIDDAVGYLQSCDDFSTKQVSERFGTLLAISGYGPSVCDSKRDLGVYLVQCGYTLLFPKMWNHLSEYLSKNNWKTQGFNNLCDMLGIYMNVTDESTEVGTELMGHGACDYLFTALKQLDRDDKAAYELIDPILGILQNVIRVNDSHRILYRKSDGVAILKQLLESSNKELKTDSLLTLAYIVDEADNKLLGDKGVVSVLVTLLKSAVKSKEHEVFVKSGSYSALELLDGLNRLAVNDDNKLLIENYGGVPAIIRMLQDGFSEEEQKVAAEALWNLSFVESIRQSRLQQEMISSLERLRNSDNKELSRTCDSALWQIKGESSGAANVPTVSKDPPSYTDVIQETGKARSDLTQIMISYQWDSQPRALEIRDRLDAAGFNVWMDVTNIKGDILTAMAKGVENSNAILICMSEKYKESQSCRSEATYAYKLGKTMIPLLLEYGYKPDGWLGILQGMDLYYEFYSSDQMETNLTKLLKAIKECTGKDDVDGPVRATQVEEAAAKPPDQHIADQTQHTPPSVCDWTTDDVQNWLKEINLPELCSTLDFCDGNHLDMLYNQYCQNQQEFKDEMKSEYQMSAKTHLMFAVALKKLFKK